MAFAADILVQFYSSLLGTGESLATRTGSQCGVPVQIRPGGDKVFNEEGLFIADYHGAELDFEFNGHAHVEKRKWDLFV